MTRTLSLIGGNGDNIDLSVAPFLVHDDDVVFEAPELETIIRETIFGRRTGGQRTLSTNAYFQILIDTTSVIAARTALRRLAAALIGEVWLIIDNGDGNPTALIGQNQTTLAVNIGAPDRDIFPVPIEILATDEPYYLAVNQSSRSVAVGVSDTTPWAGWTPSDQPISSDSPIPSDGFYYSDLAEVSIYLDAMSVDAWPEWTIPGPALSFEIVNTRTGDLFAWEGTPLVTGETVHIVTHPHRRKVTRDGVNAFQDLARRSSLFPLLPGKNTLRVAVGGGNLSTTVIEARWHDRYRQP